MGKSKSGSSNMCLSQSGAAPGNADLAASSSVWCGTSYEESSCNGGCAWRSCSLRRALLRVMAPQMRAVLEPCTVAAKSGDADYVVPCCWCTATL